MFTRTEDVHGHAVLEMMAATGQTYSRETLIVAIHEQFGEETRYCVCSGGGMSAETLVDTLMERGKFTGDDKSFKYNPGAVCVQDLKAS